MSKLITCDVIMTSASTRSDGSIAVRFATPELKPDEKTAFFELLNRELKMMLQPKGEEPSELKDVKKDFENKTPSQRLRASLFVLWKQANEPGEFDTFYRHQMDGFINSVKDRLNPEE